MKNLNEMTIPVDGRIDDKPLEDFSSAIYANGISVHSVFGSIEDFLVARIREHKDGAIFGCVAWLTSLRILKALAECKNVQIVVQKEDFLRPDSNSKSDWNQTLRNAYDRLACGMDRMEMKYGVGELSICSDTRVDAVRCLGNHNTDKSPAAPRMHNKFMVFKMDLLINLDQVCIDNLFLSVHKNSLVAPVVFQIQSH